MVKSRLLLGFHQHVFRIYKSYMPGRTCSLEYKDGQGVFLRPNYKSASPTPYPLLVGVA